MGEWLFHRVKHLRKLERYIEDIRESSSGSSRRDFDFLWGKIQDVLAQDREDANARSMLGYLAPSVKNPKGAAAKADAIPPPPMPSTKPPATDRVWLLRQRRRRPRPLGVPAPKFPNIGPSPKRNRRLSQFQMRRRPRSLESFVVCPTVLCMGATASIATKTRRMVARQRASRKGRMLLPKAKVVRSQRRWSPYSCCCEFV